MTPAELQAFLDRTEAPTVSIYLEADGRDQALEALEERLKWAAWHFRDEQRGWEAAFLLDHGQALRELLDEGEENWWTRAEVTARPHRPARGGPKDWQAHKAFLTPGVAPARERHRPAGQPVLAPAPDAPRRASPEPAPSEVLLPEAEDTPAPRGRAGAAEGVGPQPPSARSTDDHTDPIGFVATPLPVAARDAVEQRQRRERGGPAEAPLRFGQSQVRDDDVTDPSGPRPVPRGDPNRRPAPAPPSGPSWPVGFAAALLGAIALAISAMGLFVALYRVGTRPVVVEVPVGTVEAAKPAAP